MGNKNYVVAVIERKGDKILPGKTLSPKPHRKPEHAFHALPHLAVSDDKNEESVAVFCDGVHVPKTETLQA